MGGFRLAGRESTRVALVALAAATLLLAGCMGGSGDEERVNTTEAGPTGTGQPGATEAVNATSLGFEGPTVQKTVVENGSFSAEEGAFVGGGLRGADTRTHELTQQVPQGVPVTLNVTIEYSGQYSQLNGEFVLEDVQSYRQHYFKNLNTNTIYMEATLARLGSGGTVAAIVQADTTGESPQREYTLTARIAGQGEALLPLVPVSVPVSEESGGFALEPANETTPPLPRSMVWGPDGYVGTIGGSSPGTAAVELTDERQPGRYVVLVANTTQPGEPSPAYRVKALNASQAPEDPLKVVGLETTQGQWHAVQGGEATWSFNRSTPPVAVGLMMRPSGPVGASFSPDSALEGSISSPAGTVLSGSVNFGVVGNGAFQWMSPLGQENLVPGSYEATASTGQSTPYEAAHVIVELAR